MTTLIEINKPNEVSTKNFEKRLKNLLQTYKTSEISLCCNFVANDETISEINNNFRKIKNKLAFDRDRERNLKAIKYILENN